MLTEEELKNNSIQDLNGSIRKLFESYPTGWVCPKCGRVYSPTTPFCLYCGNKSEELICENKNKAE